MRALRAPDLRAAARHSGRSAGALGRLLGATAMDKWIDFYEPYFPDRAAATAFVSDLETLTPDNPRHRAKVMMHQVQRLVSLGDDLLTLRPGRDSLQLLFLIVCAENIAKLFHDVDEEGKSRAFVRRFFEEFVVGEDRDILEAAIVTGDLKPLVFQSVVDLFYSVRCDVVHEGEYWGFQFHDGDCPMLTGDPPVIVKIPLVYLRDIIVRGCIQAVQQYASP